MTLRKKNVRITKVNSRRWIISSLVKKGRNCERYRYRHGIGPEQMRTTIAESERDHVHNPHVNTRRDPSIYRDGLEAKLLVSLFYHLPTRQLQHLLVDGVICFGTPPLNAITEDSAIIVQYSSSRAAVPCFYFGAQL